MHTGLGMYLRGLGITVIYYQFLSYTVHMQARTRQELERLGFDGEDLAKALRRGRQKKATRTPTEHQEAQKLIRALDGPIGRALGIVGELVLIPNSAPNGVRSAAYFRSEGLRPGYPDYLLDVAVGQYHGLRLELKRTKGGRVAPEQSAWHERLRARGYYVLVAHGMQDALDGIKDYIAGKV